MNNQTVNIFEFLFSYLPIFGIILAVISLAVGFISINRARGQALNSMRNKREAMEKKVTEQMENNKLWKKNQKRPNL